MARSAVLFRAKRARSLVFALLVAFFAAPRVWAQSTGNDGIAYFPMRPAERESDMPRARAEWFYSQRMYPLGYIPSGARLKAALAVQRMMNLERSSTAQPHVQASTAQWTLIGPQPTGTGNTATSGRVAALAVDPRNSNVAYLGGAQGGVWKTTDGGVTWTPLTDSQASLATGAIALDPSNPDTVYVGTGEQNFSGDSYYGAGILKSTDGGVTWTLIQGPFAGPSFGSGGARIGQIAVHPSNGQIVLAAVQGNPSGIYRSTDGGNTWTAVLKGGFGTAVLFDPINPSIVYSALWDSSSSTKPTNSGVYKSTDTGQTWTLLDPAGSVIPRVGVSRIVLAIAPSSPNILYASVGSATVSALLGLYKTSDGGQSWTKLSPPDYCQAQCWYDNVVLVHPTNSNVVFAGGSGNWGPGIVRSLDGGATWSDVSNGANNVRLHVDHHAMAYSTGGAVFYEGNDGGVWKTSDAANASINWTNLNATLSITQFGASGAIHPSSPDLYLGGTQDNGTELYNGNVGWQLAQGGDGGWAAFDAGSPYTAYAQYTGVSPQRSDSLGAPNTFYDISPTLPSDELQAFYSPLVSDPSGAHPGTLYAGTQRVWQTLDGGHSWAPISPKFSTSIVTTLAVAPSNSNVVYGGTGNGKLWVSKNALSGANSAWTDVSAGLTNKFITQIVVDSSNEFIAYVTFSGFDSGSNVGHIFKTTNAGVTWTNVSGNLPNIPVNDLVIDPDVANTLYAATDVGVMTSFDGGATWNPLMGGLPHVAVLSLKLHRRSRILRAGTHGRSVWDLQLSNFTPAFGPSSLSPVSGFVGQAPALTVSGYGFTPQSVVTWNGSARTTSYLSSNQLQASITTSDVSAAGTANIAVTDPSRAGSSQALVFAIINPSPTMTGRTPGTLNAGSAGATLQVSGTNFVPSTSMMWNGSARPTTVASSSTLTGTLLPSDTVEPGYGNLYVSTPGPGGGRSPFSYIITVAGGTAPANDNFANATAITSDTYTGTVNNYAATKEASDPTPCAGGGYFSVWWKFTPNLSGPATLNTNGSSYGFPYIVLGVYTGAPGSFSSVACNYSLAGQAKVSFTATAGTTYYVEVSGYTSYAAGPTVLNATLPFTPVPQTGWWWDPRLNGTGFFFEDGGKSGNGMFAGGFLYDASGNATWTVSTGPMSGPGYANTWLKTSGGQTLLGSYKAPTSTPAGNVAIAFSDSTHALMTRPDGTQIGLQRFSFTASPTPAPPVAGAPQTGWWWAGSALSGTGYGIEIQGSSVFIVAYVYDDAGNPVWYLATGALTTPSSYAGTWDKYAGGPQLTSPEGTYAAHVVTGGSVPMTLTFSDATHGTLTMGSVTIPIVRFQEF